jgi:hypothetical protein
MIDSYSMYDSFDYRAFKSLCSLIFVKNYFDSSPDFIWKLNINW